jgi:hypothetical protein
VNPAPAEVSASGTEAIVANSDNQVQINGTWIHSTTTPGFIGADYVYRTHSDSSASVTWPFPGDLPAGRYDVFARWTAGANRASKVTYDITSSTGVTAVTVNQQANGGSWQLLSSFDFDANNVEGVTLTDDVDGVVVVNAVRYVLLTDGAVRTGPSAAVGPAVQTAPTVAPTAVPAIRPDVSATDAAVRTQHLATAPPTPARALKENQTRRCAVVFPGNSLHILAYIVGAFSDDPNIFHATDICANMIDQGAQQLPVNAEWWTADAVSRCRATITPGISLVVYAGAATDVTSVSWADGRCAATAKQYSVAYAP